MARPQTLPGFAPRVNSYPEAMELLRAVAKQRMGVRERAACIEKVREWMTIREREIQDIEHGAAWLMLQGAQQVGASLKKAPRKSKRPTPRKEHQADQQEETHDQYDPVGPVSRLVPGRISLKPNGTDRGVGVFHGAMNGS